MQKQRETKERVERKANKGKTTIFGYDISDMSPTAKLICVLSIFGLLGFIFWFLLKKVSKESERSKKKDKKTKKK